MKTTKNNLIKFQLKDYLKFIQIHFGKNFKEPISNFLRPNYYLNISQGFRIDIEDYNLKQTTKDFYKRHNLIALGVKTKSDLRIFFTTHYINWKLEIGGYSIIFQSLLDNDYCYITENETMKILKNTVNFFEQIGLKYYEKKN